MNSNVNFIVESKLLDLRCFGMFRQKIGELDLMSVDDIFHNCLNEVYSTNVKTKYIAVKKSLEVYREVRSKEDVCNILNNTYEGVLSDDLDADLKQAIELFDKSAFHESISSLEKVLNRGKYSYLKGTVLQLVEPEMNKLVRLNNLYDSIVLAEKDVVKAYNSYFHGV